MPPADFGMRLMRSFQQSRAVATFSLDTVPAATLEAARAELFVDAVQGRIHPVVHAVLPLDDAAEAHRQMDLGTVFGRIVLTP
jgi:NADPH:quinone reductase-like Zn-dependent oxidoreductase